jgi:hypothetical protein
MPTTFATLVTDENIDDIIADAAKWGLNVDYLQDNKDCYADFGWQTYAVLSVNYNPRYATFTDMSDVNFADTWYFCNGSTHGPHWKQVRLTNPKPR